MSKNNGKRLKELYIEELGRVTGGGGEKWPPATTNAIGEEGPPATTLALGEEDPIPTTLAIGEETPPPATTDSFGEEN